MKSINLAVIAGDGIGPEVTSVGIAALEKALVHWQRLATLGARFNKLPVLHNSVDPFSWSNLTPAVERDIATARAGL